MATFPAVCFRLAGPQNTFAVVEFNNPLHLLHLLLSVGLLLFFHTVLIPPSATVSPISPSSRPSYHPCLLFFSVLLSPSNAVHQTLYVAGGGVLTHRQRANDGDKHFNMYFARLRKTLSLRACQSYLEAQEEDLDPR